MNFREKYLRTIASSSEDLSGNYSNTVLTSDIVRKKRKFMSILVRYANSADVFPNKTFAKVDINSI